ncbi:MAG: PQQ-binding-like beta-propeller repeat protein [Acidobacteria bacterium]|nr:PQQ-binding-like beta-propeller repeat protein [Acidobacteriota bacterium]
MSVRASCMVFVIAATAACSGAGQLDPLAPVPTRVNPDEISAPALRVEWTYQVMDEDNDVEVPTHAAAVGSRFVFVPYPDRVEALEAGRLVWSVQLRDPLVGQPLALGDGVALPAETGWFNVGPDGTPRGFLAQAGELHDALVADGAIIAIRADGIHRIDIVADGLTATWTAASPEARRASASVDGRTLYVTGDDNALRAYDLASGTPRWTSSRIEFAPLRPAVDQDPRSMTLYVIGVDGRVYGIRQRNGNRAWAGKDIGMRSVGSPIAVDDLVWAPGLDAAADAFTTGGGSHQFRIPANGRVYLDLATWRGWIIVSPQYGPWLLVRGPRQRFGPADPGVPRVVRIESDDDILLPAAVGPLGVALIDSGGSVRLLTEERGLADRD